LELVASPSLRAKRMAKRVPRELWGPMSACITAVLIVVWPNTGAGRERDQTAAPSSVQHCPPAFVDTWDAMVARDRRLAKERPSTPQGIAAPLMIPELPTTLTSSLQPAAAPAEQKIAATLAAPQTITTSFRTISKADELSAFNYYWYPPDTMGAIGPNHFMAVLNGGVAVYNRSNGSRLSFVTLDTFFTVTVGGTTYPRNDTTDPRVIYDRRSGRWIACTLEFGNPYKTYNHIILAVSASSDPTGSWYKYLVQIGEPNNGSTSYFSDYDTLGTDDNGVYMAVTIFPSSGGSFAKIAAIEKSQVLSGGSITGYFFSNIIVYSTPHPAYNLDAIGLSDPAWFAASYNYSNIDCLKLVWSGTPGSRIPSLDSGGFFVNTPAFAPTLNAPALGSSVNINVIDFRLMMATIRSNQLWTCHSIGLNSSGGNSSADRTGCEWQQINLNGGTPALVQSGRVYDNAVSNPRFYYYPSIMVNGQGHVVMGFSGSKSTEYVGAYFTGRLDSDPQGTMGTIVQIKAGEASYQIILDGRNRWGDYSYTSLDPNDDMSLWTIQEYAASPSSTWGTWAAKLSAPAPTLNNPQSCGSVGQSNVVLNPSGTGFYDPGSGFPNRMTVVLNGGSPNGIGNYAVTQVSPTQVRVTFDIASNATLGPRDIVLTNPDGQSTTVVGGFTVSSAYSINTSSSPSGGGITSGGGTVNCGSNVTVCASPNSCYLFVNWTEYGSVVSSSPCYTFAASASHTLVANFANSTTDSVGDGIPDCWRQLYFGGNGQSTDSLSCANCDVNGTGQNNLFKYVAGLDPTNPTSVFLPSISLASLSSSLADGLVAYYPFNGDSLDYSGNENTGTVVGATFQNSDHRPGMALAFGGTTNTYVRVPRSISLEPTDAISISLWCKGVPGAGNTYGTILRKAGHLEPGYFFRKFTHDDVDVTPTFLIDSGGGSYCAFSPSDGTTWRHLAATYSRADGWMRTYVNGVEINSTELSQQLQHSGDLYIGGATVHRQDGGFNGLIDEVRIYNRALTLHEIQELYLAGWSGPTQVTIEFRPMVPDRTYTPEFKTNLTLGGWSPLTSYVGPVTNGNQVTIADTNAVEPQKFCRIRISFP
jgi:Concanavalin A-like lectin/glucanases superfamily/Divergent InlB B-repeat domain